MRPEKDRKENFGTNPVKTAYFSIKIKYPFFCWSKWKGSEIVKGMGSGFWFRIFGYGLYFTNGRLSFSERNGFKKPLKLPFGWRVNTLNRHEY